MPADDGVRIVVALAAALRRAGVAISPERTALAVAGLDRIDIRNADDVYWTLRQTLVATRGDLALFDAQVGHRASDIEGFLLSSLADPDVRAGTTGGDLNESAQAEAAPSWTATETLRTKDFSAATADELEALETLIGQLDFVRPRRRSARFEQSSRGRRLDLRRALRISASVGGETLAPTFRAPTMTLRRVVLLCDISGSMAPYARPLLLFGHALLRSGRGVEIFGFGTRLSRLTAQLAGRNTNAALSAATEAIVDWAGGTRLGETLRLFNDLWGKRAVARGAIVVVASDGWERGDPSMVAREMARLARQAYTVIWVNPCKGDPAYQPLAGGMRAALPYVDRFVSGHNLASLKELAGILAAVRGRHSAPLPDASSTMRTA